MKEEVIATSFSPVRHNGREYYGGNQRWFPNALDQGHSCGLVAAANVILNMGKTHEVIEEETFMKTAMEIRSLLPIPVTRMGINGFSLIAAMNRYFGRHGMPYRAHWGTAPSHIWREIVAMLDQGIPVLLAAGPALPSRTGANRVPLYRSTSNGYQKVKEMHGHFVTVTAVEGEWIRLSTWGECLYMNRREFMAYMKRYSPCFYTNIVVIRRKASK